MRSLQYFLRKGEEHFAMKFFSAKTRAPRLGITGDVIARDSQTTTGYGEVVQK